MRGIVGVVMQRETKECDDEPLACVVSEMSAEPNG